MQRLEANECSYKTASGELISVRGGLRVQGTTAYGYGVTFRGRKADTVRAMLQLSSITVRF